MEIGPGTLYKLQSDIQEVKAKLDQLLATKPEVWLTARQVCEKYHLSLRTIATYRERKLVPYHLVGRKLLYKQSDWDKFFSNHAIRKGE